MIKLNEFDNETGTYIKRNFDKVSIEVDYSFRSELGIGLEINKEEFIVFNKITELIDLGNLSVEDESYVVNFLNSKSKNYNPEIKHLINLVTNFPNVSDTLIKSLNSQDCIHFVFEKHFIAFVKCYIYFLIMKTFINTIYGNINSNGMVDIRRGKNIFKKEFQVIVDNQDKSLEELSEHKDFLFIAFVRSFQQIFQDFGISSNVIKSGFNNISPLLFELKKLIITTIIFDENAKLTDKKNALFPIVKFLTELFSDKILFDFNNYSTENSKSIRNTSYREYQRIKVENFFKK